jgi:predicted HTH transcriptional regulator
MKGNPKITIDKLAEQICVSKTTLEREIRTMKDKKIIDHRGPNKSGYWVVKL